MALKFITKAQESLPSSKAIKSLKYELHKALARFEPHRGYRKLHASAITKQDYKFCPREVALLDLTGKKPRGEFIGTSLAYTFDMGNLLAKQMVEVWGEHIAIGDWKCLACQHVVPFSTKPGKCDGCGYAVWQYTEVRVLSESTGASGGLDFIAKLGGPKEKYTLVELKSIKADDFKTLAAPLAEHRDRTNLYMRIIEDNGGALAKHINVKKALVLYMCKGFGNKDEFPSEWKLKDSAFSPFKEFWIDRDDVSTETHWVASREAHLWRTKQAGLPKGICANSFCKRAMGCSRVVECWSGKYPAGAMIHMPGDD